MRTLLVMSLLVVGCATLPVREQKLYDECGMFVLRHGRDSEASQGCIEALDAIDSPRRVETARVILGVVAGTAQGMAPKSELVCTPIVFGAPEHGMKCVQR
jgi:hypothetical protein